MADVAPDDCTILGMPLELSEDDELLSIQPISGFVVVKGIDETGRLRHYTAATDGLTSVECLGMAEYAALKLRAGLDPRGDGD